MNPKLLLFIPCLCFGAITLRWVKEDPSIKSLKTQLADLQQQLQGFDELKKEVERHRIELGWGKQHVLEIEGRKNELNRKIVRMSDDINDFKHDSAQMERWLSALQQQNERVKQNDSKRIQHLQEDFSANRKRVKDAQKNNATLREILDELKLRSLLHPEDMTNAT
ncbi:hypothetical protein ACHAWO_005953 [Cyclotella atomus]|uniref:Uncharacterized protein n=1 Tax=Cyclotella atomus TaxID=382360 RepID=A0ABD3NNR6_9STRA